MLKAVTTISGIALAIASPAFAGTDAGQADRPMLVAQGNAGGQGSVMPRDEPLAGEANTGGVTQRAREALPTMPSSGDATGPEAEGPAAVASGSARPADGASGRIVPPELVREVRQMALEAERNAPAPPAPTEEEKAAAQRSIDAHREAFLANH